MSTPSDSTPTTHGAVLFTDIVGFTEFTDARGDVAAMRVLDLQEAMARDALAPNGGRIVKELGDGLMLWFDDVTAGLRAAAAILHSTERARSDDRFPLSLRMGMHRGDAIKRGDDFIGQTVNIASRIADLAGPGELLVTDQVLDGMTVATPAMSFSPVGATRVKGVSDPIWLHRLTTCP
jgi:adenylate cyclase